MPNKIVVAVQKSDFDLNSEMETLKLKTEKAGAVVFFVGKVRDLEDDNLKYLEIESFEEFAKSQIKEICDDAASKWDLEYILVKHRFGRLKLNDKVIVDSKTYERLTPLEIIAFSSQVGASKVALKLGYDNLKRNYYDFGFTKPISINFPSSSFGYMNIKEKVSDKELASLGYGYGLKVSPFQIASAYSVFANNGVYKDFQLLLNEQVTSRKVISDQSAAYILKALEKVVKEGTGKAAEIRGFSEGGKTGTAHQTRRGSGYAEDSYIASFIGITPLSEESLTIFVSIDNPGLNAYTGGAVAAPLFAKIAESSLNHLGYFEDE